MCTCMCGTHKYAAAAIILYKGAEDPKLGPHVCVASILLTEPSSHAPKHDILRINSIEYDGSRLLA